MPYWGLSNFSPPGIDADGYFWATVEHYYQAQKFLEPEAQDKIRRASSPKESRELGQSRSFKLRTDWEDVRDAVMLKALRIKFSQLSSRELLISTHDRLLIESSPFDYYWGSGQDGSGQNRLGQLLMQVRKELLAAT